ncbi:hypothetical protein B0T10DRAFT_483064 [Thelonectria olida]|uniref:MARVEL domain-containing protein n=1 Tax=Thelonectria olida TaxID=1576542 RepID=A0A9P8W6X1_9HYPO|nr:hypothetical protein B0T10DRAFT_483064 [Thelonectria olida]
MGAGSGLALKTVQWFVRGVQLACAALILAIYSYFLAALHNHKISISTTVRAVEGISGFACLYTLAALLFLCCLAGRTFSSFLALLFDVAFIAAFIYVAVANKSGAGSCTGYLDTPFGKGKASQTAKGSDGFTALPSYRTACKLQSACLAIAIIAIIFFCISILVTVGLARHHHREKRFGPSPQNNYTSGYGKTGGFFSKLFRRKNRQTTDPDNVLPSHPLPDVNTDYNNRASHGTERTAVDAADQQEGIYNKNDAGYGYPQPQGDGRQDGYGQIHYPEPDDQLPAHTQTQTGYHHTQQPAYNQNSSPYRGYDDGVYDRV